MIRHLGFAFVGLICLGWLTSTSFAQEQKLLNVALTELGATATGSGAPFNKDWPANNAMGPEKGKARGTLFGSPMTGGRVDIKLIKAVEIKAIETTGLDYNGTRQAAAIDIFVDGKLVKQAQLADNPGKPVRVDLDAKGREIAIVVTDVHPLRTKKDGTPGPNYGGWKRLAVLSPEDLSPLMTAPSGYNVALNPSHIAPTQGVVAEGKVKVIGQPRQSQGWPRTLWDKQDVAEYRKMLETSPELQKQYAALKKAMDGRIQEPLNVPQPRKDDQGNWMHLPEKEVNKVHNSLGLDIANLGTVYQISGEEKYGEYAKKLLIAYAEAYPNYGIGARPGFNHDPSKVFDQRLSDATWLIQVARGYDLVHDLPSISSEEREKIEKDLLRASAEFIAKNSSVMKAATNWSAICTNAVLMVGYAIDAQDLIDLAMYGPKGTKDKPTGGVMLHFSEKSIDVDGLWSEGSTGYQMMAMEAVVADAEILWRHGVDMYSYRDFALKQLFDSPLRFAYPNLQTPAIHDGGGGSIIGYEANLWEYAYARYGDPKYLSIISRASKNLAAQFQKYPVSLLYNLDPKLEIPPFESKPFNFFGVGFGINRLMTPNGMVSMLIDYGPNRSHGHPDKLSVDLYAFDNRLIPDPGSIWYEQPLYKNWYATTVAHNTLVVDENNQQPAGATQVVYGPAETISIQRAWTDEAYSGVTMDRALFLTPNYMADLFGAFSQVPHVMDLSWHLMGDMKTTLPLEDYAFPQPAKPGYSALTEVQRATTDQPWSATIQAKNGVARFVAAGGTSTEVIVGNGYMKADRPPTILQRRVEATSTLYANAVDISGNPEPFVQSVTREGDLAQGYGLMKIQTVKGVDLAFASYKPGSYEVGTLKTDAQQAFVVMDGKQVQAIYLGGGKMLSHGEVSLQRNESGLAYAEKTDLGSVIVGNPSGTEATIIVAFPGIPDVAPFALDQDGKRTGEAKATKDGAKVVVTLAPASRVEFAPQGVPSAYEHRLQILQKREQDQLAQEAKMAEESKARSQQRVQAAAANPVPANTVVIVQAEDFSGQGNGDLGIAPNKTAAVGTSVFRWDNIGHWVEWKATVPADGFYNIAFCYCAQQEVIRDLTVNGQVQEVSAPFKAEPTNGFSNGSDDWEIASMVDPITKAPLLIKLNKGENVLRFNNSNGRSMNVDYLIITSPDVKPARAMVK